MREKILSLFISLLLVLGQPGLSFALPAGEQKVAGDVSFERPDVNTFNVNQASSKAKTDPTPASYGWKIPESGSRPALRTRPWADIWAPRSGPDRR
jgi:hypothetical protein